MATQNSSKGKTDWNRLDRLSDSEIRKAVKSDRDAAPIATREWLRRAKILEPQRKMPISMRLDEDVLRWFKARGRGYQTRINAVLRAYIESRRPA